MINKKPKLRTMVRGRKNKTEESLEVTGDSVRNHFLGVLRLPAGSGPLKGNARENQGTRAINVEREARH